MNKKTLLCLITLLLSTFVFADPIVIAHRGGTGDAPENTMGAIRKSLNNGANIIWITVQMTKDNVIVLYRPNNLSSLTNGKGLISEYNAQDLQQLNAAYTFNQQHQWGTAETIPSLAQVLDTFPKTPFVIDIKSPDADPKIIAKQLLTLIQQHGAEKRTVFYSTESKFLDELSPELTKFESRDRTRSLLTHILLSGGQCPLTAESNQMKWYGFELKRKVEIVEKFTLGEGRTATELVWNKAAVQCLGLGGSSIVFFGVNKKEDYSFAKSLNPDAVMVDSLVELKHYK